MFSYLKNNVSFENYLQHVNPVSDSRGIRKQLIYDTEPGKHMRYIDVGRGIKVDDHEALATEALVFQVVSLKGNFKCAVGYFLINSISPNVLSQLIKMAVIKLKQVGVSVKNVTFDGTITNIAAMERLGCKFPEKPFFSIKDIDHNVCAMLDACLLYTSRCV